MNRALFLKIANEVSNKVGVTTTSIAGLAVKHFDDGLVRTVAIQQNPKTSTEWARLARSGHAVVQFKQHDKFVAVAVDKQLIIY